MKKRLILLILALPLFLMLSLFAVTKTVSLAVEVPVSGIEINGEKIVYLDLDKGERYEIDYTVYPTNAKNRDVTFSVEAVGEERLAELEYTGGYIVPKSGGAAKVYLTTVDGGYKDSFIVFVDSAGLESISSSVARSSILVGDRVKISTEFNPASAPDLRLTYTSSNESVAKVNAKGEIVGVGRGEAVITVASVFDPTVYDTVEITVYQDDPLALGQSEIFTSKGAGNVNISISDEVNYVYSYKAYDEDGNELSADDLTVTFDTAAWESGHVMMSYSCIDTGYVGQVRIVIYASYDGITVSTECKVNFTKEINASFDKDVFVVEVGKGFGATFTVTPEEADVTYEVSFSNDNVQSLGDAADGIVSFFTSKAGVTVMTLRVTDAESGEYKDVTAEIVVTPKNFIVEETSNTYGDENILAVGGSEADGTPNKIAINLSYDKNKAGDGFVDRLSFVTSSPYVTVDNNGVIRIENDFVGKVTVYGVFSYGDVECKTPGFTVMCVGDGVNVRSFADLYQAVKAEKPVVLCVDVIDDFGYINGQMYYTEDTVTKMHTTYDDTYYKNIGAEDKAVIKILLEFKNDVYGNGYTINAGNVTMQLDSTGALKNDALFRGPLNFVAATESGSSAASVKAQDNVCFAVFGDVNIRNVKLYGCTLEDSDGQYDLTDLDYVGTTVEVFGDNVDFRYARIHNGRTVLRVFGDAIDSTKKITVNISNSVLGGAREFIIRTGSNAFKDCVTTPDINSYTSSRLDGDPGLTFPVQENYADMTDEQKAAYDEAFIKTFVNLKNSVLTDAGIFAIGIDAHFSGPYLQQGSLSATYAHLISSWHELAKTSYGAKVSFEGEVRMFCWKDVDTIDSSTLIEIAEGFELGEQLKFEVGALIKKLGEDQKFDTIIYDKDGKQYVHAGIALFGGGKNYGVVEMNGTDNTMYSELQSYKIGFGDVDKKFLESAAGGEKFYFILHNELSQFTPDKQAEVLGTKDAYDCIYYD